jgi:hypothetical protein
MNATRRSLLGGAAVLVAAPMVASAALPTPHPDADLIRICAEHVVNIEVYNRDGGMGAIDDPDPLYDAYARTRDAIDQIKPVTLEGMVAKARAAKAEAAQPDGTEDFECSPAGDWAWDLLNDLLAGRIVA